MTEREVRTQIGLVLGRLGVSRDLRRFITNLCWRSVQHVVLVEERVKWYKRPFGHGIFVNDFVSKVRNLYVEKCVNVWDDRLMPVVKDGKILWWHRFEFGDYYEIHESPLKVFKNKPQ